MPCMACRTQVMRHATSLSRLNGCSAWAQLDLPCDPAAAFCCMQSASYAKQAPIKPKLAQSKASQKATETKAASKTGRDSSAAVANQRVKLMLDALMPQERPRPQRSAEDLADAAERARNFSRLKMQQHREWQLDLTTKMKLRDLAIEALPSPELQAAASLPDWSHFPLNRQMFYDSPPVEESQEQQQQQQPSQQQKARRKILGTKAQLK